MSTAQQRSADYPIDPLFTARWSSRAFAGDAIPDEILFRAFEAARWAPSGGNFQPWRFVYSKRDSASWQQFLGFANEGNRRWAGKAAALILVLSKNIRDRGDGKGPQPFRSHSFDAGAAWVNFAHQANLLGWGTRAIGGFDKEAARAALNIPDDYGIEILIAVGKRTDDKSGLPAELQDKDVPNDRHPISQLVAADRFVFA